MAVYLDYAASAPLRPEARDAWIEASTTIGNPSSIHGAGQAARRVLEDSRERLAHALGCDPIEVVLTSGGTESINLAIAGMWRARNASLGRAGIVVPAAEHAATIDTVQALEGEGARVSWVPVDENAVVDLESWRRNLGAPDVAVASLLAANNEVGSIQPVREALAAAAAAEVPAHLDAVGAFGALPLSFRELRRESGSGRAGLVALSVAAHKVGGPRGVGALVVSRDADLTALIRGGGHQRGIRAGTEDVAGAAAFAAAADAALRERASETQRIAELRDRLQSGVRAAVPDAIVSASGAARLPGHLHVVFPGVQGDSLLMLLDMQGIAVSTGSACQAGVAEPSHVVLAMGRDEASARSALRLTLGRTTTDADVDAVLQALPDAYARGRLAGLSSRRTG